MKCFYHPVIEAISVCTKCGKWLCADCVINTGGGTVCKNGCTPGGEKSWQNLSKQKKNTIVGGYAVCVIIGLVFLTIGILYWEVDRGIVVLGILPLLLALYMALFSPVFRKRN